VHVALYRIAQEALNNIVKHAKAHEASLSLAFLPDSVSLRVADDGRGFVPNIEAATPGHFGLGIMRERATSIGATLHLNSHPQVGTVVEVVWHETEDLTG
jgi:signal transduction histidine kinase